MNINYKLSDESIVFQHVNITNKEMESSTTKLHEHGYFELIYSVDGDLSCSIEGDKYLLERGDFALISAHQMHQLSIASTEQREFMILSFQENFLPPFILMGMDIYFAFRSCEMNKSNAVSRESVASYGLDGFFNKAEAYATDPSLEKDLLFKFLLVEILLKLNALYSGNNQAFKPLEYNDIAKQVIQYINDNLTEHLSLDHLAKVAMVTKYYLSHIFKSSTGLSVNQYIVIKRVLKADAYIKEGLPANIACYRAGFNDYSNFYKAYKKVMGKTPIQNKNQLPKCVCNICNIYSKYRNGLLPK
jgi:AraC-like DNA-binding protein